ncbi:MAG TPA: 2-amino-4-hydroxy-6-hydroxymethyldihydropteridine diphosphokinase [Longimicrobium sp.]|jgi:2-amino-4-hydroxy-6-hydroxymethyldihydropteridine diphosphokinase|uniref:2-amino-4-hydroxy-6- hydroxymethyldihydropteridine diphosphokinase n=1 Tax=Longimicrobium sp. TaxID=2029185 RepID=UPI002EDB2533
MEKVLVGAGANVGDPVAQLRAAVRMLAPAIHVTRVSSLYRTEPVGHRDQPDFYNLVVAGTTELQPEQVLAELQRVEAALGRERTFPNAPRTLDLDLLAFGERVMDTPALTLPHPRLHLRGFVLHPLAEIAPGWRHPTRERTARELLSSATALERVQRLGALHGAGGPLAPAPPSG